MAESGKAVFSKQQVEIASLKETLCRQQMLLQKLYSELEEEREASATSATEALSMIRRLQEEKAAIKMEAEQYKRLAEGKICHAEESLSVFEDLIYQKEMEIAALHYQVQAYRYKLLSMGCVDPGIGDMRFPDNWLPRRNSAPPFPLKYADETKGIVERENSRGSERHLISKMLEETTGEEVTDHHQGSDSNKRAGGSSDVGISPYWEQIRQLDERVKVMVGDNYANSQSETGSPSSVSEFSIGNSSEAMRVATVSDELEQVEYPGAPNENETDAADPACSPGVLDVFEVPQVNQQHQTKSRLQIKEEGKIFPLADDKLKRSHSVPEKGPKSDLEDEADLLKKLQKSSNERGLHRPSDNVVYVACCSATFRPTTSAVESQPKVNQLNITSEIVEVQPLAAREESSDRGEELKLLNEIKAQLNAIQSKVSSLQTKRSPPRHKQALESFMEASLREAMLHFWL